MLVEAVRRCQARPAHRLHLCADWPMSFSLLALPARPPVPQPTTVACSKSALRCSTDVELTSVISRLRAVLPAPRYMLTASMPSVGAFGQGAWKRSLPQTQRTGMALNPLKMAGDKLEAVHILYGERRAEQGRAGQQRGGKGGRGVVVRTCMRGGEHIQSASVDAKPHACEAGNIWIDKH